MESLSIAQARRLALAAQGFAEPPPPGRVDRRHLRRVFGRVGLIQIDSVNVLARSHYVAPFSRLGPYPRATLDDMAYRHRELFEYWGHEASYIPTAMYPLFRWHMRRASMGEAWGGMVRLNRERPGYVRAVLEQVRERGPVAVSDLEDAGHRGTTGWGWNWKTGKIGGRPDAERPRGDGEQLPVRFLLARLGSVQGLRRDHALGKVVPPLEPDPGRHRDLARPEQVLERDLADYFRIRVPEARPRIHELVEEGVIRPVAVEGWRQPAYLHRDARLPRRVARSALLSPFDSLVWFRDRVHRLFGFHYRIEIYVPAHLRTHGYYVLPFLHDERIPARVDLKAERKEGFLRVQSAHLEPGEPAGEVAEALGRELRALSGWLGLGGNVRVVRRGNLASPLAAALTNEA